MSTVLKNYIVNREHHQYRKDFAEYKNLSAEYAELGLCPKERMTRRFELLSSLEMPVFLPEEKIVFMRTVKKIPDCFTESEWEEIKNRYFIHELGYISNLSPNYEKIIAGGFESVYEEADEYYEKEEKRSFGFAEKRRLLTSGTR